jgi:nickel/cobalt transporter (NicO) family protein
LRDEISEFALAGTFVREGQKADAGKYGIGMIIVMSVVFATSTIVTYVLLCVYSTAGLQRIRLGVFERYGEVLSGAFIALVGVAFWIWPVL